MHILTLLIPDIHHSLAKECLHSKKHPPLTFGQISSLDSKFTLMRPTLVKALYSLWSALTQFWEAPWASRATHIWGKTLCYTWPNLNKLNVNVERLERAPTPHFGNLALHFAHEQSFLRLYKCYHITKLYRKISLSLLLSVLLQWHSTSNNAEGNKQVIYCIFSGIAWYYDKWFYSILSGHFKVLLLYIKSK